MPRLQLHPCAKCGQTINDLINAHGREAGITAAFSIMADCLSCQRQIPDELRLQIKAGNYETREHDAPPPDTMVECGRFTFS